MVDPRRAPTPRPAPTAWARVRLLKGESAGGLWDVTSEVPEARIAIGADAGCGWVVSGAGVAPMHFELYWDGSTLWVGNPRGARDLSLDGEPLHDWYAVTGKARVEFGRAAMLIETSTAAQTSGRDSLPAGGGEDHTTVHPPAAEMRSRLSAPTQSEYAIGSTGLHRLPPDTRPPEDVSNENTRIAPGLSAQPPPSRQPAPAMAADPAATRVVSFDDMEAQQRAPKAGGPRVGVGAGTAQITDDRPTRGVSQPVPAIATEATRLGASPQAPAPGYGPPPAAPAAAAPPGIAPGYALPPPASAGAPVPAAPSIPGATGGFAAPPPPPPAPTAGQQAANLTEKIKIALKPQPGGKPTSRTWLLLALVVAVVLVFFVLDDDEPAAAPAEDGAVTQPTPTPTPPPIPGQPGYPPNPYAPGVPPNPYGPQVGPNPYGTPPGVPPNPYGPQVGPNPYGPPGQLGVPVVPPAPLVPPTPPPTTPVHHPRGYVEPPPPPTEERIAADLVAAGRWREALPHYQMLAAQNPNDRTYGLVVSILQHRLAIACVNGLTPTGEPCTGL